MRDERAFNFFIVLPEILAALCFGDLVKNYLHGNLVLSRVMEQFPQVNRLTAVVAGGVCMIIAALVTLRVKDSETTKAM